MKQKGNGYFRVLNENRTENRIEFFLQLTPSAFLHKSRFRHSGQSCLFDTVEVDWRIEQSRIRIIDRIKEKKKIFVYKTNHRCKLCRRRRRSKTRSLWSLVLGATLVAKDACTLLGVVQRWLLWITISKH